MIDVISISKLKNDFPYCYKEFNKIRCINIDSLLNSFGISIILNPINCAKTNKLLGYCSSIRIRPDNKMRKPSSEYIVIEDYKKFKTQIKAEKETVISALEVLENNLRMRII